MKFLIKYASRGRRQLFAETIENIIQSIRTDNYVILVSADYNDPEMLNLPLFGQHLMLVRGNSSSKVAAINRDMEFVKDWDILVNMSDDMKFTVNGWDEIIEKRFLEVGPDCFLHFNDGFVGDKLPTMSIMDRKYYERDNYIYYPEYKSFSCDAEQMYVAMARKRWFYFDEVIFNHLHPGNLPSKIKYDELYRANSLHSPHDEKVYWERLHRDFDLPKNIKPPFPWDVHKKY